MKNNRFPIRSLYCAVALCLAIGQANAVLLYEDDFSGAAGSIVNIGNPSLSRQPNLVNTDDARYQGVNNQPSINATNGYAYSTNGGGAVSLALPSLAFGDVITLTLTMRTITNQAAGYVIAGFTKEANSLTSQGVVSAGLSGDGRLRVGTGTNTTSAYLSTSNDSGVVLSNSIYTSPLTTFVMTYTVGTGALQVSFDNDSISPYVWNGTVAASIEDLKFFTFQFNGANNQNNVPTGTPANTYTSNVDYLSVDVQPIPEPQAVVLILGGLGLFFVIRRARHRMMLCGK